MKFQMMLTCRKQCDLIPLVMGRNKGGKRPKCDGGEPSSSLGVTERSKKIKKPKKINYPKLVAIARAKHIIACSNPQDGSSSNAGFSRYIKEPLRLPGPRPNPLITGSDTRYDSYVSDFQFTNIFVTNLCLQVLPGVLLWIANLWVLV